ICTYTANGQLVAISIRNGSVNCCPLAVLVKDSEPILEIKSGVFYPMTERKKQKILILSGDYGDGHKQAARALGEACLVNSNVEVEIIDFMEWTHPHLHSTGKYLYLQLVKNFPEFYGYLFRQTRYDTAMSYIFKKIRSFSL